MIIAQNNMFSFSKRSLNNLKTCHKDLQSLARNTLNHCPIDFAISCGYRSQEEQFKLFSQGRRQEGGKWVIEDRSKIVTNIDGFLLKSKHNSNPSLAFDFVAYVDGKYTYSEKYYCFIAGFMLSFAQELGFGDRIVWGGNFDMDNDIMEKGTFHDLGHIELIE